MECAILTTLEFRISKPHSYVFLRRFLQASNADEEITAHANNIIEGTLLSVTLLRFLPSQIAAAAVLIAREWVGRSAWSPTLVVHAHYREDQIAPVAQAIRDEQGLAMRQNFPCKICCEI